MPTARRCQGCGATLGEPTAGVGVVTCRFCGLAHDAAVSQGARATVVVGNPRGVRRATWMIAAVVLLAVAAIVAGALIPAYVGVHLAETALERATSDDAPRRTERDRPLPPAALATLTQGGGWRVLATEPPVGGYADFDPVASLPWAMTIARAWASDAVLTRVDVGRVAATGAVDVAGEHGSGYRFVSPGRQQQWINESDAGGKPLIATGLMLQVTGNAVRALPHEERRRHPATAAASLPLAEILERARRSPAFADKPYYSGYLVHLPREGWVWYFSPISGAGSYPRVRARDGKTYPYR